MGILLTRKRHLLFLLLSLSDLALTCWLLGGDEGRVYEANPLARWWLAKLGWLGLASYKLAAVLLVLVPVTVIARSRPHLARRILGMGCATLTLVVFYSASLCWAGREADESTFREANRKALATQRLLADQQHRADAYRALLHELGDALRRGRCSLGEAAMRLAAAPGAQDAFRVHSLAFVYPSYTPVERFALTLCGHAVVSAGADETEARRLARRLEIDFETTYASPIPKPFIDFLPGARKERRGYDLILQRNSSPETSADRATSFGNVL